MAVQDQLGNAGWITDVFNYRTTHISSRKKRANTEPSSLGSFIRKGCVGRGGLGGLGGHQHFLYLILDNKIQDSIIFVSK